MPKPGFITPSRFADIMTTDRSGKGFGKMALNYADEVVCALLGVHKDEINAKALEWGKTHEPAARKLYELYNFCTVPVCDEPLVHPEYSFICGNPDARQGIIGNGGCEIKCPYNPVNHYRNIKTAEQYKDYKPQIQGYMMITGAEWWDFVSYDPRFLPKLQYSCHTFKRDDEYIKTLTERCLQFWDIVQVEYQKMLDKL